MNLHLRARNVLAAAIAAVVATMTGAIAPTRARAVPDAAARPAAERAARSLLLITGDQLVVRPEPGGRSEIAVRPGAPDHDELVSLRRGGVTDLIPADALPYLGRGLDPSLFDVPQLLRAEAGGRLPLRITCLKVSTGTTPPGHIWVRPIIRKPSVGTLQAYATQQLASDGRPGTPYAYNLNFADPPGSDVKRDV
jgi:hypothetical protein